MKGLEIKSTEFLIKNSWTIRVDKNSIIDFDGKVIFYKKSLNPIIIDRLMTPTAVFKEVSKEEFENIIKEINDFYKNKKITEIKEGNFVVYINEVLANTRAFYTIKTKGITKYDNRLVVSSSVLENIQWILGTKVYNK